MQQNLENMSKLNQNFGDLWTSPEDKQQPKADKK
jgi:hypothetical protein